MQYFVEFKVLKQMNYRCAVKLCSDHEYEFLEPSSVQLWVKRMKCQPLDVDETDCIIIDLEYKYNCCATLSKNNLFCKRWEVVGLLPE